MIDRELLLERVRNLPTLPVVAGRLLTLLQDPTVNAARLEEVIRPDPALTANLLRLANAAAFGHGVEITSLRQASTRLGLRRLSDLALGLALGNVVPALLPGYGMEAGGFFLHSAATAILAEHLDRCRGGQRTDVAFTAGLLHDAGKLVIGAFLAGVTEEVRARLRVSGTPFIEAERAALGLDHAEAGALIAERWGLPAPLARVMRHHHAPAAAPPADDGGLLALVHVADGLAHSLGFGADLGELARSVEPQTLAGLSLSTKMIEAAACESLDEIVTLSRAQGNGGGGTR
jgi:putative nucleotidyltransferase with HDIG domain